MKLTTDQDKSIKDYKLSYSRYIFVCEAMEYAAAMGLAIPKFVQTRDNKWCKGNQRHTINDRLIDARKLIMIIAWIRT